MLLAVADTRQCYKHGADHHCDRRPRGQPALSFYRGVGRA